MVKPCQWVYRYNGKDEGQECEDDLEGRVPMPKKGDTIVRNGKRWIVVMVSTLHRGGSPPAIPVHTVALSDDLTLQIHP